MYKLFEMEILKKIRDKKIGFIGWSSLLAKRLYEHYRSFFNEKDKEYKRYYVDDVHRDDELIMEDRGNGVVLCWLKGSGNYVGMKDPRFLKKK